MIDQVKPSSFSPMQTATFTAEEKSSRFPLHKKCIQSLLTFQRRSDWWVVESVKLVNDENGVAVDVQRMGDQYSYSIVREIKPKVLSLSEIEMCQHLGHNSSCLSVLVAEMMGIDHRRLNTLVVRDRSGLITSINARLITSDMIINEQASISWSPTLPD